MITTKFIEISIHRMVALVNVLCPLMEVLYSSKSDLWKIADFGLTSRATTTQARTTHGGRGKQSYRAPELLREPKLTFNKKVDIWSFGCILYELITGRKAFESDFKVFEFLASPIKPELVLLVDWLNEPLKTAFAALIDETIQSDYQKRPSADSFSKLVDDLIIKYFPTKVDSLGIVHKFQPSGVALGSILTKVVKVDAATQYILTESERSWHDDFKKVTLAGRKHYFRDKCCGC